MTNAETTLLMRMRWIGAAIFLAAAVFAPLQTMLPRPACGSMIAAPALELVMAAIWVVAGVAMITRLPALWYAVVLGAWTMLMHGTLTAMGVFWPGLPFLVGSVILGYLCVKTAPLFRRPMQHVSSL